MRRRELMLLLGGFIGVPRAVFAQQNAMRQIGFLGSTSADSSAGYVAAFLQGLREARYVEGQNVTIEYRWAEGRYDRLPILAAELVDHAVDVIVATGGPPSVRAAKTATSKIPIVFTGAGDPVGEGLVTGLARPGGNVTGVTFMTPELVTKRLELILELVPQVTIVGLLVNPNNSSSKRTIADSQESARTRGLRLEILQASSEDEFNTAFENLERMRVGALVLGPDPFFDSRREQLVALAARHVVPAIYEWREFAVVGGLISYGPSITAVYHRAGVYAGRILKGAEPADLPVEQPTTFELAINLNTAKSLGLTIPPSILARADEVIE